MDRIRYRWLALMLLPLLFAACQRGPSTPVAGGAAVDGQRQFSWKIVTTWPANFPIFQEGVDRFAEALRTMSQGQLDIKVYAADELVPALQVFDAVSQGTVQMGHGASYYWAGKVPEAQFFSAVPFGMSPGEMDAWLYYGGGLELWREIYADFQLVPFPMGNTGAQMGGWFNRRMDSLADIPGIRMRIPGLGGKVLKRAGGNPVLMAGGEIYTALERGTIDATEWVSPFHDLRLGLDRAAKYYYYPGWHEPGTNFELIINADAWQSLPMHLQSMVRNAAAATAQWIFAEMEYANQQSLRELAEYQHVQILAFPQEVLQELRHLTELTLQAEAEANAGFARVYSAWREFRKAYQPWSRISEQALLPTRADRSPVPGG